MTPAMAAASIERSRVRQRFAAMGGSVAQDGDDVTRSFSPPYGGPVWRRLDWYGGTSQPSGVTASAKLSFPVGATLRVVRSTGHAPLERTVRSGRRLIAG